MEFANIFHFTFKFVFVSYKSPFETCWMSDGYTMIITKATALPWFTAGDGTTTVCGRTLPQVLYFCCVQTLASITTGKLK